MAEEAPLVANDMAANGQAVAATNKAKKKIFFLAAPMKGHYCHTARMADWFLQYPDEYEVHIAGHAMIFPAMGEGIIAHVIPEPPEGPAGETCAKVFEMVANEGKNWYHGMGLMVGNYDIIKSFGCAIRWSLDEIDELHPDVVIFDHTFCTSNVLHTYCRRKNIPCICITSYGRPEAMKSPKVALRMLCCHFGQMKKVMATVAECEQMFLEKCPKPWLAEGKDEPFTFYPGCQDLVPDPPKDFEVYIGPFLPIPGLVEEDASKRTSLRRQSTFNQAMSEHADLSEFLARDSTLPIVYVALGTLVKPKEELIKRIYKALDCKKWRVVWALPKSQQPYLPKDVSDTFLITDFAPQYALLRSGRVGVFLSHCGGNSTMESLSQGVPMVCLPFFFDQYEWADSVCVTAKAGIRIDKVTSTEKDVTDAVTKVLGNKSFLTNAQAIQKTMLDDSKLRIKCLQENWSEEKVKVSKQMQVGIPVAAGIIDAAANKQDIMARLPKRKEAKRGCLG